MFSSRIVWIAIVLLAFLLVPIWFLKDRERARQGTDAAERKVDARAAALAASARAASAAAPADRLGLTFGWSNTTPPHVLRASCQGLPAPADNAFQGGCNLYAGDTSCRILLPVLCLRDSDRAPPALATVGSLAGFLLTGEAHGTSMCATELGAGWRMARYEDTQRADITAERAVGVNADTTRRAWIASRAQPVNCWDVR